MSRRTLERIPAAYLTGHAWFGGLRFRADPRALIPRSPIGEWIERGFSPWLDVGKVAAVLDVGTGGGCIAIACATVFPDARVDAVDVDRDALALAAENVRDHDLEDRVRLVESDLFAGIDTAYDLIVANPPYVAREEFESLPAEYRHEPARGLRAGEDGVDVIDRILTEAGPHLRSDGLLVVEAGSCRSALEARYSALPFLWLGARRRGRERVCPAPRRTSLNISASALWRGCGRDRRSMHGTPSRREPPGRARSVAAWYPHAGNHSRTLGSTLRIDAAQDV